MANNLFSIGNYYDFSVYANSVLGANFTSARCTSIMDYDTALKFANIELIQKQILPYIPIGSLTDQKQYTYYLFKLKDGRNIVVADTWVIASSVQLVQSSTYTLKLYDVSTTQLNIIRDQLNLMGISFDIS